MFNSRVMIEFVLFERRKILRQHSGVPPQLACKGTTPLINNIAFLIDTKAQNAS